MPGRSPRARRRLRARARRPRGERPGPLLELSQRAVVRGMPRRGNGPRAAGEARVRRRADVGAAPRGLLRAPPGRGPRRPGALHDLPQRAVVHRLPHAPERRAGHDDHQPAPARVDHDGPRRRRSRRAGAHRSGVVRGLPRGSGRAALRRMPSRRRSWRKPARARVLEHEEQDPRHALSRVPRPMRRRRALLWTLLAAVLVVGAAIAGLVAVLPHGPAGVPPELVPASWAEYKASPGHETHVGQGKAACKDCHDYEREGFKNPGSAPCVHCHDKQAAHAHPPATAGGKKVDCLECHSFAPDRPSATCIGCHSHPQGTSPEIHEHSTTACTTCHTMHAEPFTKAADCVSCHEERSPVHAQHADSKGCADCHAPHAPAVAALGTCSSCHAQPAGPRPAGHDSCLTCHKPHDFVAGGAAACSGCHGMKPTLAASTAPAHTVCTSCHTPHAPAAAASSCEHCHSNVHLTHDDTNACTGCHVPHPESEAKVAACTSCHVKIASADTGAHKAGTSCVACHEGHDFTPPAKPALCTKCHANEVRAASTNPGHADCATCHGASTHAPAAAPACGSCHTKEQATAPAGHAKCTGCHEPHAGAPGPQAACASCHANKTTGPHAAVKGACETCHRPHGPGGVASPPPCASCHATGQLPALHTVPAHGACASCHSSHESPRSDRATCTGSCHADKRDHQPQAAVCTGCHVFRQ